MKRLGLLLILASFAAGCATQPTPQPTTLPPTPAPTWTVQPTYTPRPTYTPFATWTALPTATFTPAATATPTPVTHLVQPGDSLNGIAKLYQVPPDAIAAANAIQDSNYITTGQVLVIPIGPSANISATVSITATRKPVVRATVAAVAPPPQPFGMIYPAPPIIQPLNGITLVYDASEQKPGTTESITFAWLPVGQLEGGDKPCTWPAQPNGTHAYLYDRYQLEFNPPVISKYGTYGVFHNDHGLNREFNLLEFKANVVYTWRAAVGRWCVAKDYDNQDPKHQGFLGLVSPYTAPRTFSYIIP